MARADDTAATPLACSREELDETVRRWLEANQQAEATGDWTYLGAMYRDDAEYRWTVGPGEEFVARGRHEIERWAIQEQMAGFEGWQYPYDRVLIDERRGEVVGFWRQVSPVRRADGTRIEVAGIGGSWFGYGGDYKWAWQRDFFDLLSVFGALSEIAAQGELAPPLKEKIATMARGKPLAGHERLRPAPGIRERVKQGAALAKVAILGK